MPTLDLSGYDQPTGSTSDGTKYDNALAAIQSTINALDNNNIAANAGIAASKLADPTTGKVLGSSGAACAAVFPPGYEYDYKELVTSATFTATTFAGATTLHTADAVTFDGSTTVWVEIYTPHLVTPSNTQVFLTLWDGSTDLGIIAKLGGTTAGVTDSPVRVGRRLTPSAAAHTYTVRGVCNAAGTGTFSAGAGGTGGTDLPAYIRITKV